MTQAQHPFEKGLISVIAGNYNTPVRFIKKAIDSVLKQTYQNFEFIIVDDCSTDDSLETIKSYDDPRIKIMSTDKNSGLATALNKAFEVCRGEYIARMDLDDICFPDRFEKQIAFMRANPDVILCGTQIRYIDDTGHSPRGDRTTGFKVDRDEYRIYLLFANNPMIIHPTWMFNSKLLFRYGIRYKEQYKYSQDYAMLVSCAKHGRCAVLPDVLLKYRVHDASASGMHKQKQRKYDYQIIQEQLNDLHLIIPEDLLPLHHRYLQSAKLYDKRMKHWLDNIIKANEKYHVYDQDKLKSIIRKRWIKSKIKAGYHHLFNINTEYN